jgi:hypothetical protein
MYTVSVIYSIINICRAGKPKIIHNSKEIHEYITYWTDQLPRLLDLQYCRTYAVCVEFYEQRGVRVWYTWGRSVNLIMSE